MPQIPIEEVKEGMILEEPAVDSLGRVLLEAGEKLNERYIAKLKAFGIEDLMIKPEEPAPVTGESLPKMSRERQDEIIRILQAKFAHTASDPQMKTLYEIALAHLTGEKD